MLLHALLFFAPLDNLNAVALHCANKTIRKATMTKLLEEAIAAVTQLPESQQDAIASLIIEEIASEKKWQEAFEKSQPQLEQLAEEALEEFRQGGEKNPYMKKRYL